MGRFSLFLGGFFGATGVALGAFGAHALRDVVTEARLEIWQTATSYQQVHALVLLLLAALPVARKSAITALLTAGVLLFSGSLYLLVLTDKGFFGAITPLGGVSFILAWTLLAVEGWRTRNTPQGGANPPSAL